MLRRLLLLCALLLAQAGCSGSSPCAGHGPSAGCTRVLFVGNSYTFVNDLPAVFAGLAAAGGHEVQTGMAAEAGATLARHAASAVTAEKLGSAAWGFVVLQEQSQIPALEQLRRTRMFPAARTLVRRSRRAGAEPILFLTWAHRDGWPEYGLGDYTAMQSALDDGYLALAREQRVAVAPVGYAWWALLVQQPGTALWEGDGSHPSVEGTYLAACVFYAAIFRQSPSGLDYRAGLPADEARSLQEVATSVVLGAPERWGLR
jgi:hypothetical protein